MTATPTAAPDAAQPCQNVQVQPQRDPGYSATSEDDRDLLKLGYRAVLARGWGAFDNFACTFSALYTVGGIRVLFYLALSGGGPAAMYVTANSGSDTWCID